MATAERPNSPIYLSYAAADRNWAEIVTTYLRQAKLEATWQQFVRFSSESEPQASEARRHARVFILLVSNAYLTSDDIHKNELPQIREMVRSGQARIIYLVLESCPWRASLTSPAEPTVVIPREERVLEKGTNNQRRQDLDDLVQEIRRALERTAQNEQARGDAFQESGPAPDAVGANPPARNAEQTATRIQEQQAQPAEPAPITAAEAGRARKPAPAPNAPIPPPKQVEGVPPLAQRLAVRVAVGNYQAMATLVSPSVLLTPAHVLAQSRLLELDEQSATIEFLGMPEQPQRATVLDMDEARDFAVLQLERAVAIAVPANLVRATDFVENTKWDSYWSTTSGEFPVSGRVAGLQTSDEKTYLKLETTSRVTTGGGMSGAPVIGGESLLGIVAAGDSTGKVWYAIPLTEMLNSSETDAVAALVPADSRRPRPGRSPWITEEDFGRFSDEAINVLSDARQIGRSLGSAIVHIRHLLLAFFWRPGSFLAQLLLERDVDLPELLKLEKGTPLPRGDFPAITKLPPISVNVRRALSLAIEKAGPAEPVDERHVLFGVLSATRNADVQALNQAGIRPALVRFAAGTRREAVLAGYQSDDASGVDLLDITPEVEALASVLAAKDVEPPLSLGLFGDWGTGKSFFMGKLEAEIRRLGEDAKVARDQGVNSAYCSNIVQIPFNAWNYIDTDLWASLTAEIFEGLAAAIVSEPGEGLGTPADTEKRAAQRELVLAATSSSEAVLLETKRKTNAAEEEVRRTEEKLSALKQSEAEIESGLTAGELAKQAFRFALQTPQGKSFVEKVTKAARIPEVKAATRDVQSEILELESSWSAIAFTLKHEKRLWIWLLALGLALAGGWYAQHRLAASGVDGLAKQAVTLLTGVAAALTPLVATSRKILGAVRAARDSKRELIESKKQQQVKELEERLKRVRETAEAERKRLAAEQERVKELNDQLAKMYATRRMADYIRDRQQSTDYKQHLGIISRVRTDLRHLSTLLRDVNTEGQDESEKKMKERQSQQEGGRKLFPRIDRIILYIDDLDRCPEKNVVEVLQAVHLLLAFPLFVVVVGVDPRWLLYSLQQSSAAFRVKEQSTKNGDTERDEWQEDRHWQSTPLNYLEKIFQIPYSLRPINQRGFGQLVDRFASGAAAGARANLGGAGGPANAPGAAALPVPPPAEPLGKSASAPPVMPSPSESVGAPSAPLPAAAPPVAAPGSPASLPPAAPVAGAAPPAVSAAAKSGPPVNRSPEHLNISDPERLFMKKLNEFIPTPRSGKRFINIYRLLRASVTEEERAEFSGDTQGGAYQAAMLLLAMLTGYPEQATEILRRLIEKQPGKSWWDFMDRLQGEFPAVESSNEKPAAKRTANRGKAKEDGSSERSQDVEKTEWDELFERMARFKKGFKDRPIDAFQKWAPRVARYSFQSGRVLYYNKAETEAV